MLARIAKARCSGAGIRLPSLSAAAAGHLDAWSPPTAAASPPDPKTHRRYASHTGGDHWLDRFQGVRDWLEDSNRRWWIKGLAEARCKQHHQLEGREVFLQAAVQREYAALVAKHAAAAVDSRGRTHLAVACLALATHKALLPFIRDEDEVLQIISEHMGAHTAPALM